MIARLRPKPGADKIGITVGDFAGQAGTYPLSARNGRTRRW
jgi:hypothetical protein